MPKVVAVGVPVTIADAVQVFGTELRVGIVHALSREPGRRQTDVAVELGVDRSLLGFNVRKLVSLGVLTSSPAPDGRSQVYAVNHTRVEELLSALRDYSGPPPSSEAAELERS